MMTADNSRHLSLDRPCPLYYDVAVAIHVLQDTAYSMHEAPLWYIKLRLAAVQSSLTVYAKPRRLDSTASFQPRGYMAIEAALPSVFA